jgi:hypothetical protein
MIFEGFICCACTNITLIIWKRPLSSNSIILQIIFPFRCCISLSFVVHWCSLQFSVRNNKRWRESISQWWFRSNFTAVKFFSIFRWYINFLWVETRIQCSNIQSPRHFRSNFTAGMFSWSLEDLSSICWSSHVFDVAISDWVSSRAGDLCDSTLLVTGNGKSSSVNNSSGRLSHSSQVFFNLQIMYQ